MTQILEHEIIYKPNLALDGLSVFRDAVRGIIQQDNLLLMVYSDQNGDYKFPGGGVEPDETHPNALARELKEECGAKLMICGPAFARISELDRAYDEGVEIFKMVSTYYLCQVASELGQQKLDEYEKRLGFRPIWVDLDEAIHTNEAVVQRISPPAPRWTYRDLYVLHEIKKRINF
jgi:8-oxo-dGTP pyrophosphatase MutT (NUDIX family)